jgi:nickel/cobalt exporter
VFTILLVCLQVKQVTLGFALVLCFSVGLALTLVTTGAVAAWSVRHASKTHQGLWRVRPKGAFISPVRCWSRWASTSRSKAGGT